MAQRPRPRERAGAETGRPGHRGLLGAEMPGWLVLLLVGLGLPRTILSDLGVVEPEGSAIYYVLALVPFAVWLAVAIVRRTGTPIRDHLLTGAVYGLSLVVVHEAVWAAGPSIGHRPPQSVVGLAGHGYAFAIAMMIGLGVGLVAAAIATAAKGVRTVRAR